MRFSRFSCRGGSAKPASTLRREIPFPAAGVARHPAASATGAEGRGAARQDAPWPRVADQRDQPSLSVAAFCPPGRSRYTRPGVATMINRDLQRAKEEHPEIPFPESSHPHAFRASRAIDLLDSGVDVIRVRDFPGHVSVQTTEIYLRVTTEQTREAVRGAYPALVEASDPELRKDKDLMEFLRDMCRSQ